MKKFMEHGTLSHELCGSPSWVRTNDLRINSPSLYRLSYRGIEEGNYTQLMKGTQEIKRNFLVVFRNLEARDDLVHWVRLRQKFIKISAFKDV